MSDKYTVYFDGCCEPRNPGGTAAYGVVILKNGERVFEDSKIFEASPNTSNNVAEYAGFNSILDWFSQQILRDADITVYGDSKLVIEQMFGTWNISRGFYVPLAIKAKTKLKNFSNIKGEWIPREENSIADELSKKCLLDAGVKFKIQPND